VCFAFLRTLSGPQLVSSSKIELGVDYPIEIGNRYRFTFINGNDVDDKL
jgi:hypothetical protein